MNINIMVGVGIFIGPPLMAQKAGNASFLGWPLVALIFLPVVLSIATMARIFPGAGSFYSYAKHLINEKAGFVSGWTYYLAYTGVAALQTICLRDIVLQYVSMPPFLFNLLFIGCITLLSFLSIKLIGQIQNAGTIFKLLPILLVLAIFVGYWNPSFHIAMPNFLNVPLTVPLAIFGFWGFEVCCTISHLIEGDESAASRAILYAFFITAIGYSLFHFGLLHIMGPQNLTTHGAQNFVNYLGISSAQIRGMLAAFVSFTIGLAFVNAILSMFTTTASTLEAMAQENLFPYSKQLTKKNLQQRPWIAILFQGFLTLAVTYATNNKNILISMINLGVLIAFLLTLIALTKLQRQKGKSIALTLFAFVSWSIFIYFSWIGIGPTHFDRLLYSLPFIAAIVLGYMMFTSRRRRLRSV
jgi:amino acid transporter